MAVFVHVVNMPLLFTSTALVPTRQMPSWLESVAPWNPLTLVADGLRDALFFHRAPAPCNVLLPLALLAVFFFVVARRAMAATAAA